MNLVSLSKSNAGGPAYVGESAGENRAGFSFRSSNSTPDEMKDRTSAFVGSANRRVLYAEMNCAVVSAMPPSICRRQHSFQSLEAVFIPRW